MVDIYISDTGFDVRMSRSSGGKYLVTGLPIFRTGTWNDRAYTADDIKAIAANFDVITKADAWSPPLRPYHGYSFDGQPLIQDAREVLGWFRSLRYDETTETLLADVELVDEQAARDMMGGKLRYVSAEIMRSGYRSPASGLEIKGPVLLGAAFVSNPAVKGMPWNLVINAQEYKPRGDVPGKDDEAMSLARKIVESLRELFEKAKLGEEELSLLGGIAAEGAGAVGGVAEASVTEPAALADDAKTEPSAPAGAQQPEKGDDTMAEKTNVEVETLTEAEKGQLEQLHQAMAEQQRLIEQLTAEARLAKVKAYVDGWVASGTLPPALRLQTYALVDELAKGEREIEIMADDKGNKRKVGLVDLFAEILQGMKPALTVEAPGRLWQGSMADSEASVLSPEEIEKAAQSLLAAIK